MKEDAFRFWLSNNRSYRSGTVSSRLSNCRIVEEWEGDLDQHFNQDHLRSLLGRLIYSKEDEHSNQPARHHIPIDGNVYNGTATYKSAVSLYRQFRETGVEGTTTPMPPVRRARVAPSQHNVKTIERGARDQAATVGQEPLLIPVQIVANHEISAAQLGDWRRKLLKLKFISDDGIELNFGIFRTTGTFLNRRIAALTVAMLLRTGHNL